MTTPHRTAPRRKPNTLAILIFGGAALFAGALMVYALAAEPDRVSMIDIERGDRVKGVDARMSTGFTQKDEAPSRMRAVEHKQEPKDPPNDRPNDLLGELTALLADERRRAGAAEQQRMTALLQELKVDRKEAEARLAEFAKAQAEAEARFDRQLEASLAAERERHQLQLASLQAERQAELEDAARAHAQRAREARRGAKTVLIDDAKLAPAGAEKSTGRRQRSADERFLAEAYQEAFPQSLARPLPEQGWLVAQGTLIQATLETALSSELPGMLRAVVSEDVWSFDGARIVIPSGSRLIGRYSAETDLGQERVLAVWTRLIRPDGTSIALGSPASDDLGRAGLAGEVDSRFAERFGSAALISIMSAVAGVAEGRIDKASGEGLDLEVVSGFDGAARSALERYLTLKPVVRVQQGAKVTVFVARDLVF